MDSSQAFGITDYDLLNPVASGTPSTGAISGASSASGVSGSDRKKVKVSSHVDQMDDNEVEVLTSEVDQAYLNFRQGAGADPLPEADPAVEKITIMNPKINKRGECPYADFSV